MSSCCLCIHGHFYQPSRVNPFTGKTPPEPDAAPYANWNERITAECYAPNAEGRPDGSGSNFEHISFNLGGTLAHWLDEHAHDTYERIIAAERSNWKTHGVGNGLAQPVHHTILPLARRRDKYWPTRVSASPSSPASKCAATWERGRGLTRCSYPTTGTLPSSCEMPIYRTPYPFKCRIQPIWRIG
jgi:alpha-amylase/alpha-mannosidase (GH57 family)